METIISALITGITAIIGGVVQNSKTRALIEYRLIELEKKQHKHNDVIKRMFIAEKNIEVQEEQIKVANHRIQDLEVAQKNSI